MKEPKITYSELMAHVAKYQPKSAKKFVATAEQLKFLKAARAKKMQWQEIIKLWNNVWGNAPHSTTLRDAILNRNRIR